MKAKITLYGREMEVEVDVRVTNYRFSNMDDLQLLSEKMQAMRGFAAMDFNAYTDKTAAAWFAPAGLTRGGLKTDAVLVLPEIQMSGVMPVRMGEIVFEFGKPLPARPTRVGFSVDKTDAIVEDVTCWEVQKN